MSDPPASYPADVRESFEFCPDCETPVVSLDQHTCPPDDREVAGRPSAAERARLAAADDRPADDQVLYPKGRSQHNAWAYHELDADGSPLHDLDYSGGSETGSRADAIGRGCYPCGRCRIIRARRDDDG